MENINTHHFTWVLKRVCCGHHHGNQGSCSKIVRCLWRCNTWTRPGLFWSACLPNRQLCVYFRDREGPWATLILLLLFAQVDQDTQHPPPHPAPNATRLSSSSLCYYLIPSPSFSLDLFVFLFCFSLSLFHRDLWSNWSSRLHKEIQIGFHLQPVTSCVHSAFVLPCRVEKI